MELTIDILIEEAKAFSQMLSAQNHSSLIGVTDGKAAALSNPLVKKFLD